MADASKLTVILFDQAGAKIVNVQLPGDAQIGRLVPVLITKMSLPSNVQYIVQHKESGKVLNPNDTLFGAGIKDGDRLRLIPNIVAGGLSMPIRTFRDIQLFDAVLSNRVVEQERMLNKVLNRPHLFGVFLYTDEDTSLSIYIRENLVSLSRMSSDRFLFFVIEKLAPELDNKLRKTFGEQFGYYSEKIWDKFGFNSAKPYQKNEAYEIGRRMGVNPDQFPCIVLFDNLASKNVLVLDMKDFVDARGEKNNDEYTKFFRMLFSHIEAGMIKPEPLEALGKSLLDSKIKHSLGSYAGEQVKLTVSVIEVVASIIKLFA